MSVSLCTAETMITLFFFLSCVHLRALSFLQWPGRIWGGRYSFQGVNYTTPLQAWEDSAWHGLLRYRAMSVEDMWNNTQEAGVRLGYTFDGEAASC